jgi:hypothetical protein
MSRSQLLQVNELITVVTRSLLHVTLDHLKTGTVHLNCPLAMMEMALKNWIDIPDTQEIVIVQAQEFVPTCIIVGMTVMS